MADMILAYEVRPDGGEVEFDTLKAKVEETVKAYGDNVTIKEIKEAPMGFGLMAVYVEFQLDENLGSENLENNLLALEEVGDVVVKKMDRL